jgi:hypothetical protein
MSWFRVFAEGVRGVYAGRPSRGQITCHNCDGGHHECGATDGQRIERGNPEQLGGNDLLDGPDRRQPQRYPDPNQNQDFAQHQLQDIAGLRTERHMQRVCRPVAVIGRKAGEDRRYWLCEPQSFP